MLYGLMIKFGLTLNSEHVVRERRETEKTSYANILLFSKSNHFLNFILSIPMHFENSISQEQTRESTKFFGGFSYFIEADLLSKDGIQTA